jgi:hypothetical protein
MRVSECTKDTAACLPLAYPLPEEAVELPLVASDLQCPLPMTLV